MRAFLFTLLLFSSDAFAATLTAIQIPELTSVWSESRPLAGEGAGDMAWIGAYGGNAQVFAVASSASGVRNVSLYALIVNSSTGTLAHRKIKTLYTPSSGIDPRAVCYPGGDRIFVGTYNNNNSKSQMRIVDLKSGNQISSNGIGSVTVLSCTFDGQNPMVLLNNNRLRRFKVIQGKRFITSGTTTLTGVANLISVAFNGKDFWAISESGTIALFVAGFAGSSLSGIGILPNATRGLMFNGKNLFKVD
jgi:hypothetical protein